MNTKALSLMLVTITSINIFGCIQSTSNSRLALDKQGRKPVLFGEYFEADRGGLYSQNLLLNRDSTFVYNLTFDVGSVSSFRGKWRASKDSLLLEEEPLLSGTPNSSKGYLKEAVEKSNIKVLYVYDYKDSSAVVGAQITINGLGPYKETGIDGQCQLPDSEIRSIEIKYFNFYRAYFTPNNPNSNIYKAYIMISGGNYLHQHIPVRKWLIRADKLLSLSTVKGSKSLLTKVRR